MIIAAHTVIFAEDADRARAFFRDVLGLPNVDAGGGWLIFRAPPAELAVHPSAAAESGRHALYLVCDDIDATIAELAAKGVSCSDVSDEGWGLLTSVQVPEPGPSGCTRPSIPSPTGYRTSRGGDVSAREQAPTSKSVMAGAGIDTVKIPPRCPRANYRAEPTHPDFRRTGPTADLLAAHAPTTTVGGTSSATTSPATPIIPLQILTIGGSDPTAAQRADQRVRTRGLNPQVTAHSLVLEPDTPPPPSCSSFSPPPPPPFGYPRLLRHSDPCPPPHGLRLHAELPQTPCCPWLRSSAGAC